jgi:hypothetical protein
VLYHRAVPETMTNIARRSAGVTPARIALTSTVIVALLLFLPIRTFGPGDHEKQSCGNTVSLDLDAWRGGDPSDGYFERAVKACTTKRVNRLAESVGVISLTILVVTVMTTRRRSRAGDQA